MMGELMQHARRKSGSSAGDSNRENLFATSGCFVEVFEKLESQVNVVATRSARLYP
jgi:hypothetical protein